MKPSIYRFLTSWAKKPKNNLDRSSWGSTDSLAIGAFNAGQVTVTLNQTSTEKTNPSTEKERLLEKRECFLHLLIRPWPGRGNRSTNTLAGRVGLDSASTGHRSVIDWEDISLDQECKATGRENIFYISRSDLNWDSVTGWVGWPIPRLVHHFFT